jgi:hypothetical protein
VPGSEDLKPAGLRRGRGWHCRRKPAWFPCRTLSSYHWRRTRIRAPRWSGIPSSYSLASLAHSPHTHTHDESRKKNPSGLIGHCSSIQLVMWIFCWTDLLDIHVAKSALKALAVHGRRRTVRGGRLARSRFGPVRSGGTVDDDGLELEPRPAAAAVLLRYSLQQQSTVAPTAHHALPDDGSLGMEKTAALRQPM